MVDIIEKNSKINLETELLEKISENALKSMIKVKMSFNLKLLNK